MAAEILLYISCLGIILLLGLFCAFISNRLRIPHPLFLILIGLFLGNFYYNKALLISFSSGFIAFVAAFASAIIIFDYSSKVRVRELDSLSTSAFYLGLVFFIFNSAILSFVIYKLLRPDSYLYALLFAIAISGTSYPILSFLGKQKNKVLSLLETESVLTTPFILIFAFLMLEVIKQKINLSSFTVINMLPFAQKIAIGAGIGLLMGILLFNVLRKNYFELLSPLTILTSSLASYAFAEQLGGNGFLAAATAGFLFGNFRIEERKKIQEFFSIISFLAILMVLILAGFLTKTSFDINYLVLASFLFGVSILIRFLSVLVVFSDSKYNLDEKIFMSLNIPQGINTGLIVLVLILGSYWSSMIPVLVIFMIYSIILSTLMTHFSKSFIRTEHLHNKETQ